MSAIRTSVRCRLGAGLFALLAALIVPIGSSVRTSQGQHEAHHGPADSGQTSQKDEGNGGGMMEHMGGPPPMELYPSLMELPDLPPEGRGKIEREADERVHDGMTELSEAWRTLSNALPHQDYRAIEDAEERLRQALAQVESGVAARRALAGEGDPRRVALAWFKREMNLEADSLPDGPRVLGLTWFHGFVMLLLTAFSVGMLWTYVAKTRRAANLLRELTGADTAREASAAAEVPREPQPAWSPGPAPAVQTPVTDGTPGGRSAKWKGRLRVARIFDETPDVKTFRLVNPLGGMLPFSYLPGQFLTVTVPADGKEVKRGYTIASSPTQRDYAELTVKHEEGGVVSGYLHLRAQEGDLIDCAGPSGSFIFTGRECRCILLIGAGVGITPLMSVLRYLTDRAWPGDIYLMYGCHSPRDIIFQEEIEYLQRRHRNLHVVVTVSHPEGTDWTGPTGRITKELISRSVPDLSSRYVHLCGPVPMIEAAKEALAELGVPMERIKTEAFGPALGRPEPTSPLPRPPAAAEGPLGKKLPTVVFAASEKSAPLPPDTPILDVADEIGVEIDNSCRVGTCGVCRVKLLAGTVMMAVEDGLEPTDKENNIILACQAKSSGDVTVEA